MRKITREIVQAFLNSKTRTIGNSSTGHSGPFITPGAPVNFSLYLHGNQIAERRDGQLWISSAGWQTNTTKERLNGLPGVSISQRAGVWFLNGKEWNGEFIKV